MANWEKYRPALDRQIKSIAQDFNRRYGTLVNDRMAINMDCYEGVVNNIDRDQARVFELESRFAAEAGKDLSTWAEEKERRKGTVAEKASVVLMYRVMKNFPDGILALRSSASDDYSRGIDTIFIDQKTGHQICGVDEVNADRQRSADIKKEKIQKIIDRGGAFVKYGAKIKDGRLEKCSLKHLPAFYLSLADEDLEAILPHLEDPEISPAEKRVFRKMLSSLESQVRSFYGSYLEDSEDVLLVRRRRILGEIKGLKAKYGEREWYQSSAGEECREELGQNSLALNICKFRQSLMRMKNIIELSDNKN